MDCSPLGSCPWDSPGKNTGVGCHALLQGILPTQGSNPHLLPLLPAVAGGFFTTVPPGKPRAVVWLMVESLVLSSALFFKAGLGWEACMQERWTADFSREARKGAPGGNGRRPYRTEAIREFSPATPLEPPWAIVLTRPHSGLAAEGQQVAFITDAEPALLIVYNLC